MGTLTTYEIACVMDEATHVLSAVNAVCEYVGSNEHDEKSVRNLGEIFNLIAYATNMAYEKQRVCVDKYIDACNFKNPISIHEEYNKKLSMVIEKKSK